MKQEAHAWIAIRAVELLDHDNATEELAEMLKPHVHKAAIGAWMPDLQDAKLGGSQTSNHIFKLEPYLEDYIPERFVADKSDTRRRLGSGRLMRQFIDDWADSVLDDDWWEAPYKADPPAGKHIPNRAMAISVSVIDLLITGNDNVQEHVPRDIDFIGDLTDAEKSTEEQVAMWCFYMSHFIADACMPCHTDARPLASFKKGKLHKKLEEHWSGLVGPEFSDETILSGQVSAAECLDRARNVDSVVGIRFKSPIPKMMKKNDVWHELVNVCRGSFVMASIICPPDAYPYDGKHRPKYADLFDGDVGEELLEDVDRTCLHDAVVNTAMVWKHVWGKF